jgi:hypothetical protein
MGFVSPEFAEGGEIFHVEVKFLPEATARQTDSEFNARSRAMPCLN